jgi:hypothetical protein
MRLAANGQLWYGKLSDRVGYLHVGAMEGFADTLEGGKTVLANDLDRILREFHDLDALVVDIRRRWKAGEKSLIAAERPALQLPPRRAPRAQRESLIG